MKTFEEFLNEGMGYSIYKKEGDKNILIKGFLKKDVADNYLKSIKNKNMDGDYFVKYEEMDVK
jgi:hypothetical protein